MVQVFIDFLKENKAYERYFLRYKQTFHNGESCIDFLYRCNIEGNYAYMLAGAFDWHTTDKEFKFWHWLMRQWLAVIKENRERLESLQW